ncbi:hypothetical protein HPB48_023018 [Haemaphysalis longicornis]|uniref:CCHC-type domain-containing protein n=1 Tax=Haemaphysalis longicornis TaxID=44386 RepID=A0A9J6GML1_HAELO|nr:hypothetical protein HPB48_023018 [Haemaphysalis longicornis]
MEHCLTRSKSRREDADDITNKFCRALCQAGIPLHQTVERCKRATATSVQRMSSGNLSPTVTPVRRPAVAPGRAREEEALSTNMAARQTQRGYDPEAMAWSTVPDNPAEEPSPGEPLRNQNLFKLVERRSRRQPKTASPTTSGGSAPSNQRNDAQRAETSHGGPARQQTPKWKPKPFPRLHPNDYQVIVKPRNPVALRDMFQCGQLGEALLGETAAATLTLLPSWEQNLIVTGTPDARVADRLLGDFQLTSPKGPVDMRGNLKQTDNVCKGVITVANNETTESLQQKIKWRAGEIVDIRKYGTSNSAQLTFAGKTVPQYVHYNSEIAIVRKYKKTIPACIKCGTVGHRAYTCPNPNGKNCGLCGQKVAVVEGVRAPHDCQPKCATCGLPHSFATNSRPSARRNSASSGYRPPRPGLPNSSENIYWFKSFEKSGGNASP